MDFFFQTKIIYVSMFACFFMFSYILYSFQYNDQCKIEKYSPIVISDVDFDAWLSQNGPVFSNLSKRLFNIKIEGHIFQQAKNEFTRKPQIYAYYHYLQTNRDKLFHICETGFNGGHSALFWAILFHGNIEITAFDLCINDGCDIGERFIRSLYPTIKLTLERGDSRQTIVQFANRYPNKKCNFISIDGGHIGDIPMKDNKYALSSSKLVHYRYG